MIPIWNKQTGDVWVRNFDEGVLKALGALPDPSDPNDPCYSVVIAPIISTDPAEKVPVYFSQPNMVYRPKKVPSITISRDDFSPALQRWMGVGQLEYRAGVSGTEAVFGNGVSGYTQYVSKPQAMPYDFSYTIVCTHVSDRMVQGLLRLVLKSFPPIGKLFVNDSLGLLRSYEARSEGPIPTTKDSVDAVNRFVSYTVNVRVDGEIDLTSPYSSSSVTGFDLVISRF